MTDKYIDKIPGSTSLYEIHNFALCDKMVYTQTIIHPR